MRVLLVSFYAEAHLSASSAQNTRRLARMLVETGHAARVICAGETHSSEVGPGYEMRKLPMARDAWGRGWRPAFRADPRVQAIAEEEMDRWRPDVVLIGAWKFLTEFALAAHRRSIPSVQVVHDYSLICQRQWLLDGAGRLCSGPGRAKCLSCFEETLGLRSGLRNRLLSVPWLRRVACRLFGAEYVSRHHLATGVMEAWDHMEAYRKAITLFVAQAPSVVENLASVGIEPARCRFLPQFIGSERLVPRPRPEDPPGSRPLRVVYVGRWSYEKGPDLLLRAFCEARLPSESELWLISRNVTMAHLAEFEAGDQNGKTVRCFSDASGAEVAKLVAQCDLAVVPSRCRELASRVVIEAHAQGVPVVVSNTVGNAYLIEDRVNGRVVPAESVSALRAAIEEVAASPATVREWSSRLPAPVTREAWTLRAVEILEEAVQIGACRAVAPSSL